MGKKVTKPVFAAVAVLILLVIAFMLRGSLRGPAHIVLPEVIGESENTDGSGSENEVIDRIDIRPSTVQAAVATLERPQQYSRSVRIERYYSGGSAAEEAEVYVSGDWTRIDLTKSGETRRVITGDGKSWIWYGASKSYYTGAAALSADEEQSIPTYEDILLLDTTAIAFADYRMLDTKDCIYVETAADSGGYVECYWVSLGDGLLVAAEKSCGGEVVYRMAALDVDTESVKQNAFTLPDGTVLHTIE